MALEPKLEVSVSSVGGFVPESVLPSLKRKADTLFSERVEPLLTSGSSEDLIIIPALKELQLLILGIDYYYENNWELDPKIRSNAYEQIVKKIEDIGYPSESIEGLLKDIVDYEKIERGLRDGIKISDYQIHYFYLKKSCDVCLQREIGKFLLTGAVELSSEEERAFDILGEILDDIDDLEEDNVVNVYNGNRFLEAWKQSSEKTKNEYYIFIFAIKDKYPNNKKIQESADKIIELLKFPEKIQQRI
jgi:hypothetical protein